MRMCWYCKEIFIFDLLWEWKGLENVYEGVSETGAFYISSLFQRNIYGVILSHYTIIAGVVSYDKNLGQLFVIH